MIDAAQLAAIVAAVGTALSAAGGFVFGRRTRSLQADGIHIANEAHALDLYNTMLPLVERAQQAVSRLSAEKEEMRKEREECDQSRRNLERQMNDHQRDFRQQLADQQREHRTEIDQLMLGSAQREVAIAQLRAEIAALRVDANLAHPPEAVTAAEPVADGG